MEEHVMIKDRNSIKSILFFILMTIPFYQVDFFIDTISWMGKAYTACQILAGITAVYLYIKDKLYKRISPLMLMFGGIFAVMCIGAVVNGGSLKRSLEYGFATMIICLITEYGILKDPKNFLKAEIFFFGSLTAVNLVSVLLFRDGLYMYLDAFVDTWFLGYKSGHIAYHLAFLFYSVIYVIRFNKKIKPFLYIAAAIVFVSNVLVGNATATVALLPLIAAILIPAVLDCTKILNIVTYAAAGIALELIFVIFRVQEFFFGWLIVDILHKRIDLTSRVFIWDKAMAAISEHPVVGHGYQEFVYSATARTTHNEILEVLFKSGTAGLIFFLAAFAFVIWRLYKNKDEEYAKWTALFLGIFFLMFIVEQYAFAFFFYLMIIAWHGFKTPLPDNMGLKETSAGNDMQKNTGRAGKSARNFIFAAAANMTAILIGLIAQRLFIRILGLEYAGLNGLFSNVFTMLGIMDLGIGEAVIYNLYKPLQENDRETVLSLMNFYRKAFHIVAAVIAFTGICLIPVIPYIAKTTEADVNLNVIYLIFLADIVFSYLLSYKRAILYADQKNFIISMIHMGYLVGMNLAQLLMIYYTHNYYAYLSVKLVFRILENLIITVTADRLYPYLKRKKVEPLSSEISADIRRKTGALFFHKIGTFVVNGTDNILISVFFNLTTAGLYNNYYLVTDAAAKLFNPAIAALTPSVGNMLVTDEPEHVFQIFRRIRFMTFWIACFAATSLLTLIQPFISLWFGEQYVLAMPVVIMIVLQFFQLLMRNAYSVFQDAAGIFYENRFVPLAESALNLFFSIILLKIFGLAGVFAGTIVSSMALWCFSYPKFVYIGLLKRPLTDYIREMTGYLIIFLTVCITVYTSVHFINNSLPMNGIVLLFTDTLLCVIMINILLALIFHHSDCFRYFLEFVFRKLG